jgi:hypothetical protein
MALETITCAYNLENLVAIRPYLGNHNIQSNDTQPNDTQPDDTQSGFIQRYNKKRDTV